MRVKTFVVLFLSTILFAVQVFSQTHAQVSLDAKTLASEWRKVSAAKISTISKQSRLTTIETIRVSAKVPGLGAIQARFDTKRNKDWISYFRKGAQRFEDNSKLLLLRGRIKIAGQRKRTLPIAAALFQTDKGNILKLNFRGQRNKRLNYTRYYELELRPLDNTISYQAKLRRVPSTSLKNKTCADDNPKLPAIAMGSNADSNGHQTLAASEVPPVAAATYRVIDISTEADYEWFQLYGSSSNSQIASILNSAEVIYEGELSLTYNLIAQQVITTSGDNYPSSDAEELLYDFTLYTYGANHLGDADVYHLFTDKELVGDTIGLAYLGQICVSSIFSTGLSQHTSSSLDYITFAHELGHGLNATHDSSLPASIMFPSAGPGQTSFSSFSRNEIASFVSSSGSCLSSTSSDPTPTPNPSGTATPAATATPGGGGTGGGGGGSGLDPGDDVELPDLTLSGSLSSSGTFNGTLSLSGVAGSSSCDVSLMVARGTSFSSTFLVELGAGDITSSSLQLEIPFSVKPSKPKENLAILVKGLYFCSESGDASVSNVLKLKPVKVRSKRKLKKSAWIKKFVNLARSAAAS